MQIDARTYLYVFMIDVSNWHELKINWYNQTLSYTEQIFMYESKVAEKMVSRVLKQFLFLKYDKINTFAMILWPNDLISAVLQCWILNMFKYVYSSHLQMNNWKVSKQNSRWLMFSKILRHSFHHLRKTTLELAEVLYRVAGWKILDPHFFSFLSPSNLINLFGSIICGLIIKIIKLLSPNVLLGWIQLQLLRTSESLTSIPNKICVQFFYLHIN